MTDTTVGRDGREMTAAPAKAAAATDEAIRPYPSPIYAAYAIGVLMLITLNSLLDRFLPSLLVEPIRASLDITDTQISLIQGYAFALFFVLLAVPFGRLVDRTNRRNLIALGLIVWSATTVLCGFATNMWMLFLGRMGVGIGEACLQPAAYSLIADYVKPKYRGRALGIFFMSLTVGAGLSMILGATVLKLLPETPLAVPGLGVFEPWQVVFLIAGVSGLVIAPLLATVREPTRRDQLGRPVAAAAQAKSSFRDFLAYVAANGRTFAFVYACYVLMSFSTTCVVHWAPTFFARRYDLPLSSVGVLVGVAMIVGAVIGALSSGFLSDRWIAKEKPGARLMVGLLALGIFLCSLVWTISDNLALGIVLFGVTTLASTMAVATSSMTIQDLVPNNMRGQAVAVYVLFSGMLAMGLGPSAVALVTDYVFGADEMLGYSIILVSAPTAVVSILLGLAGVKSYQRTRTALLEAAA